MVLDDHSICPSCRGKVYAGLHHCMIETNGLPDVGLNHMKYDFEMDNIERGWHYAEFNEYTDVCSYPLRPTYYSALQRALDYHEEQEAKKPKVKNFWDNMY